MQLFMKQKMFSFKQDFDIYDINQNPIYHVDSKLLSFGRQMEILDGQTGQSLCLVKQKVFSWTPTMEVYDGSGLFCRIRKQITFFKPRYSVEGPNWQVDGSIWQHNYQLTDQSGTVIADIQKKYLSWSDTFMITIHDETIDPVPVVATILAIDMAMDQAESN